MRSCRNKSGSGMPLLMIINFQLGIDCVSGQDQTSPQKSDNYLRSRGQDNNKKSPTNWEELRRHPSRQKATTPQSLHRLQWDASHLPPKLTFSFDDIHPSNTPIPRPIPLTNPNGIQIQSAVLPQYTFRNNTQTDRNMG